MSDTTAAVTAVAAATPTTFDLVWPLTILVALAIGMPVGLFLVNKILAGLAVGTKNVNPAKLTQYESGISATTGSSDERFSVKFYLVAMLFLAFDIEVAFLYPWAIQFNHGGWGMVWILVVFLVILEVGYLYLYRKGALDWDK
jgi:NADH-quinone oxidoreductase subunit A